MKKENQEGESQNKRETNFQDTKKKTKHGQTNVKKEPNKQGNRQNYF